MRLFLSYSTPDFPTAERIRQGLTTERPDLDIYFAPRCNELGAYWIERLDRELAAADAVLLLIGRRIGPWQELEYYEAMRRNRSTERPLIIPILLADVAPGLPFFDQFHRLSLTTHAFDDLIALSLGALDGISEPPQSPAWRRINPYPGLAAMGTQDAAYFFGREGLTARILSGLERFPERIHTLIGNSGVGKSSLAMAGVLAALRGRLWPGDWNREWPPSLAQSHSWPIVIMKPGEQPVKALAQAFVALWQESPATIETEALQWRELLLGESTLTALVEATLQQLALQAAAEPPQRLVLYVDQGEELYSHATTGEAARFSELLAKAATNRNLLVMFSLRSDFYGHLQNDQTLFEAAATVDVPPLNRGEIERIIRLPAERLQIAFDNPDVVALIAKSAARETGTLPMLSDLLSDAWRAMAEDFDNVGVLRFPFHIVDIGRPLTEKAERFLAAHLDRQNDLKRLFTLKLAHVTKAGEVVRRRARRSDCSEAEWSLVEALVDREWRLLSVGTEGGEPVAEVAHEALLRNWPRVSRWLDESREFLIWKGQLEPDRIAWEESAAADRSRALLTGLRLDKALYWLASRGADLSVAETRYIADSEHAAKRTERQRLWIQRAVWLLLLLTAVAAGVAFRQRNAALIAEQQALANRDRAEQQARLAVAGRLAMAAEKVLEENIGETTLAGLLAVESLNRAPTFEAQRVLRRVLQFTPADFKEVATPWPWSQILQSPDGRLTAFSRTRYDGGYWTPASGKVAVIDAGSWQVTENIRQDGRIRPVLSRDGRWLATAGYGRRLQIVDLKTQRQILSAHQDDMFDAAFGIDDSLYVAHTDGVIEVREAPAWDIKRTLNYPLEGERRLTVGIEINPNGQQAMIYRQTADKSPLNPWLIPLNGDASTALGDNRATIAAYSPSGKQLATVSWNNRLTMWDTETATALATYPHDVELTALAYGREGKRLITANRSGEIVIRDSQTGTIEQRLHHESWVNAVAVSANGELLATASDDRTAALWKLNNGEKLLSLPHDDEVWAVEFGRDDQTLITGGKDGALRVFDIPNGKQLQRLEFDHGIDTIAYRSASNVIATGFQPTQHRQAWTDLLLVDRKTGDKIARIEHNGGFNITKFSPDGRLLATTTGGTGGVKLWDTASGALKVEPGLQASSLDFNPDGSRLVVHNHSRETIIVDTADGNRLTTIGEPGGIETVRMSGDLQSVITFGKDLSLRNWDMISGKELWRRPSGRPDFYNLQISGDGKRCADLSADGKQAEVFDLKTGQPIARIPVVGTSRLLLSSDGRRLLTIRKFLIDSSAAKRKHSVIELWDVDDRKRLFNKKYLPYINAQALPGNRYAITGTPLAKSEPESVLEILDAAQGKQIWSVSTSERFNKLLVPKPRTDLLIVETSRSTQIRQISSGKLIAEIAGSGIQAAAAVNGENLLHIANLQSLNRMDSAIQIRKIDTGNLVKQIPVSANIHDLAVSDDGKSLYAAVSSDYSQGVRIWRRADWMETGFIALDGIPKTLFPLQDPDLLAVLDYSNTLRVWRISSGRELHRFSHTATSQATRTATKANRVITSEGASLRLWNAENGAELASRLSNGQVSELAISPDGHTVAYLTEKKRRAKRGGDYQALEVWETDGEDDPIVLAMKDPWKVSFDPAGRRLAVSLRDQTVRILDAATLRIVGNIDVLPGAKINQVSFSADSNLLFVHESGGNRRGLRAFSLDSVREIARIDDSIMAASMPVSDHVITRDVQDRWWRSWTVSTAEADEWLFKIPLYYRFQTLSENSHLIGYGTQEGVEWFDTNSRDRKIILPEAEGRFIRSTAADRDGKRVAVALDRIHSGKDTGEVIVFDAAGGKEIARLHTGSSMAAMAFADGGNGIVMSDSPGVSKTKPESALWLWQWRVDKLLKLGNDNPINAIAMTSDGMQFATAEGDYNDEDQIPLGNYQVRVWDGHSGTELHRIDQAGVVHDLAFSLDRRFLAVKMSRRVIVYRTDNWQPVKEFTLEGTVLYGGQLDFAAGNRIVVGGQTNLTHIWSLDGKEHRLIRHASSWPRFRLSGDRRWLALEDEGDLEVWSIETGREYFRRSKTDGNDRVTSFAFSGEDGNTLLASVNGRMFRIPWQAKELSKEACRRFARNMTEQEWQRFFDREPYRKTCR